MEEIAKPPYDVWFIADMHLRHKNILRHQKKRIEAMNLVDDNDIDNHDKFVIEMWLKTVKRNDHVYILGDFILDNQKTSLWVLNKLKSNGCKLHLIIGNHDKSTQKLTNMFESIDLIKVVDFKKSVFTFLDEDLPIVMCHYPMVTWPRKAVGAIHLFGHIHANSPWINEGGITGYDLALNVGMDTPLSNYGLINLKTIYKWYKEKLGDKSPKEYIDWVSQIEPKFVR